MSVLSIIRQLFKRDNNDVATPAYSTSAPREGGIPAWMNSRDPAMCVATAYRCTRLLCDSVAQLGIDVKSWSDAFGIYEAKKGPLWSLLNVEPEPGVSAFDYWSSVVADLLLKGNSVLVPVYKGVELVKIAKPSLTSVQVSSDGMVYEIHDEDTGIAGTFKENEVIHLRGFGGYPLGKSVIGYAQSTIAIANVSGTETYNRIANGGDVRGVVGNDRTVRGFGKNQDQQLQFAAIDIDEKFRSGQRIVHLPGMVEFKQLSMSSADMQFLETRKFTVREICRFFGVHPSFVFDDTSNNYKSAEMASAAFLSNTLNPLLRKIETELLRKLVPADYWQYRKIQFDRSALYACDLTGRAAYQKAMLESGIATVNELRRMEDMRPVEGGDSPLVSANLKPITELTTQPTNNGNEQ